jgi:hypothetical protein
MDTLANYLAKPAKNDLEKVRAVFLLRVDFQLPEAMIT